MSRRFSICVLLMLAPLAAYAADGEAVPTEIKVGDTTFQVVDRIVAANPLLFHKPEKVKKQQGGKICRIIANPKKNEENCSVPAGRASYGILLCGPTRSFVPETLAETFARVPGKDAPNLAAAIIGVQIGKRHGEGELEIAILVCGPRIAVPVMPDDSRGSGPLSNFNRISVRISSGRRGAELTLKGIEARPESYRIAAMNQAVLFVVPFKALDSLKIEKDERADQMQTQSIDLLDGEFSLGRYSATDADHTKIIERQVLPVHYAVRVKRR
jgi:hypothetical protein